jgi:broad specificity phosphatase PhoE
MRVDERVVMERIQLVRHGRSAHVHDGRWMYADSVHEYERGYDDAGILGHDSPPQDLIEIARRADVLVASDLTRAIESARRLAPGRDPVVLPLLREITLEPPRWMPVPLPIMAWDALSHAQWSYRLAMRTDHPFVRRADRAADWLAEHAVNGARIVAVTHAGFRRIVAHRLQVRGWRAVESRLGYANWSVWSFILQGDTARSNASSGW